MHWRRLRAKEMFRLAELRMYRICKIQAHWRGQNQRHVLHTHNCGAVGIQARVRGGQARAQLLVQKPGRGVFCNPFSQ
jgi:hypothetical protein